MKHRIYAVFYALYSWSEYVFFASVLALVVIPFTSLPDRAMAWWVALHFFVVALICRWLGLAVCSTLQRRHRTAAAVDPAIFADDSERARHHARLAALDAERRLATTRQQDMTTAWWVNRNRGF